MARSPAVSRFSGHNAHLQDRLPLLRASTTFCSRIITDWWCWELASLFVSFACLGAIVGVLSVYDGKRQPEYLFSGITLNAYVAVFAAISKAALILPVAEAIGQLKWIWFQKEAALWDFQLFDAASRGPWGSVMLLFRLKSKHLASLGATITILGLAFEPFFQQILAYPERVIAVDSASTWAAMTFHKERNPILRQGADVTSKDPSLGAAIDAALNTPYLDARPSTSHCSSGNCTWPPYSTLGVCHQCEDMSQLLHYICQNNTALDMTSPGTLATDPCGFRVNNTFIIGASGSLGFRTISSLSTSLVNTLNLPTFGAYLNSTVYQNFTLPILDIYVGFTPGGPYATAKNVTPVLLECLFTWCVKTLHAKSVNGLLQESVIESVTIQPDNPAYDFVHSPGMWQFHQEAPYDIEPYLKILTTAMTNNLKSRSNGTMLVGGTAWAAERFVRVRWAWMVLPATSFIGSLILICTTILKGRGGDTPTWKSSSLATLIHGLSEETRNSLDPKMTSSEMEAISANIRVQLSSGKENARLVAV
ncbi:hypothetical protein T440DRAFT_545998 [Plenodomus tracheiphilus IPT5]|uniref:Uncharacterized protein n=1 Tax=Plenodomus tracheiphilus IPT5 TaxID=1408161 RepID=A0A6A7BEE8_9PLEO|nr:hypothetical protein T440DRAFT_545998 [Plenodomus tracheiphilus IPT5]